MNNSYLIKKDLKKDLQKDLYITPFPELEILGDYFEHAENSQYSLFYKAELYNNKALLKKHNLLESNKSRGDLMLFLYQKRGLDFFKELDGKFAIILVDKVKQRIFVARDIFASIPVYFFNYKEKLYFSSEIKLIASQFNLNLDFNFLGQYLCSNIVSSEQTIYSGVKRARPGFISVFYKSCNEGFSLKKNYAYWSPPLEEKLSKDESLFLLRNSFNNAIQKRLDSFDRAALSLSGGLDSGIVFSWIKKNFSSFSLSPYTSSFSGYDCDESKEVRELLDFYQSSGDFVEPKSIESKFLEEEIKLWGDLPNYPTGFYLDFLKGRIAENGHRHLITAYGADEIFSAREEFSLPNMPLSLRNFAAGYFPKSFKSFLKNKEIIDDWTPSYFSKKFKEDTEIDNTLKSYSNKKSPLSSAKRRAEKDLFGSWAVHLRELEMRASSRFSLSLHSPFLDKEFIESYFKVPSRYVWDRRYFERDEFIRKKLAREALGVCLPKSYLKSSSNAEFSEVSRAVLFKQIDIKKFKFQNLEDLGWLKKKEINEMREEFSRKDLREKSSQNLWSLWSLIATERLLQKIR